MKAPRRPFIVKFLLAVFFCGQLLSGWSPAFAGEVAGATGVACDTWVLFDQAALGAGLDGLAPDALFDDATQWKIGAYSALPADMIPLRAAMDCYATGPPRHRQEKLRGADRKAG